LEVGVCFEEVACLKGTGLGEGTGWEGIRLDESIS